MKIITQSKYTILAALAVSLVVTGCASTGVKETSGSATLTAGDEQISDPFEGTNRFMMKVNEGIDKAVLEPVARGYRYVAPKPIRNGVRNFLRNLKSPIVMANELLQGDLKGFANASGRLLINTTIGVAGLFDIADQGGIPYEQEDFGQTLAVWGVGNGPYMVIPVLGPSTLRDGTGLLVDSFADPVRIYMFNHDLEWLHYTRVGVGVVDTREEYLDIIDDLRRNSFDYYAAVRSAYYQRRQALVRDMDPSTASGPEIPDYQD
ncbi:MAG: vacJ like lipofamily protein [Micavibrio aeruginosavorus]|uniref:VacJ like lipofamily protein n=1 Tax=Micavibrio aeruginosavorus TaxID=349221 RepID=A0A2W5MVK3_9BACT|nr:MAG: vacJ like lipofamily protein [Micavibrio aeruginosavorus]